MRGLWQLASGARRKGRRLDLAGLADQLGLLPRLQRKPWVLLNDHRAAMEEALQVGSDDLLRILAKWLADFSPAAVGLAHVSGTVYLAPALEDAGLTPEQVLIANLFSHGEMGLDALASPALPDAQALSILQELATFSRVRWMRTDVEVPWPEAAVPLPQDKVGMLKPVRRSVLKKHPLLRDEMGVTAQGNCLQHPSFVHHDIEGDTLEEMQNSAASIAAKRGYAPGGGATAGCALRTEAGMLVSGSEVSARSGAQISPLQCALVSLSANGLPRSSVQDVAWCANQPCNELEERDRALLARLLPSASFRGVRLAE
ncbi:unnamed protein product [Effrenium voratum]|nr:unnamed protein product [Effrenium voratum]